MMTVISSHLHHGATMREQSTALVADPLGESAEVRVWWPTTTPTTTTTTSSSSSGASTRRSLPAILFHHGTALGPSDYTSLCSHIASYGFVVVCRRHYNGPIGLLRWQNEVRAARHMQAFVTDTGIYVGEHSFHAQLLRAVGGAEEQAPVVETTKGLLLAGHSRGAAIAFLAASTLRVCSNNDDHNVALELSSQVRLIGVVAMDPVDASAAPFYAGRGCSLLENKQLQNLTRVPRALILASEIQDLRSAPPDKSFDRFRQDLQDARSVTHCEFRIMTGACHASFCDDRVPTFPFRGTDQPRVQAHEKTAQFIHMFFNDEGWGKKEVERECASELILT